MIWVLFVSLVLGNASAITSQEFSNRAACVAASKVIFSHHARDLPGEKTSVSCVRKS